MRRILAATILALTLTGCGVQARNIGGVWVDTDNGRVYCIGAGDGGGIDCDWDHAERHKP